LNWLKNKPKGNSMSRIPAINPSEATGKVKELLDAVQIKLGVTPNMARTMAQSLAVLEAYINFSNALGKGKLKAKVREQIALVSAEANQCGYCAAAHTAIGKMVGLNEDAILAAREASAEDAKTDAALKFARAIVERRGAVSDADLEAVKNAGFSEGEIAEVIANVALNIFTNYFNETAKTEIDFPRVELPLKRSVSKA
jgi:uncharacterized peroxidase-related enzyme